MHLESTEENKVDQAECKNFTIMYNQDNQIENEEAKPLQ